MGRYKIKQKINSQLTEELVIKYAEKLANPVKINEISFDGSSDITLPLTPLSDFNQLRSSFSSISNSLDGYKSTIDGNTQSLNNLSSQVVQNTSNLSDNISLANKNKDDIKLLNSSLSIKASKNNVYSKSDIDDLLSHKASKDISDTNTSDIEKLKNRLDTLTNGSSTTLDTLKEIGDQITKNSSLIDTLNNGVGKISDLEKKVNTNKENIDNTINLEFFDTLKEQTPSDNISLTDDKKAVLRIANSDSSNGLMSLNIKKSDNTGYYTVKLNNDSISFKSFKGNNLDGNFKLASMKYLNDNFISQNTIQQNYYDKRTVDSNISNVVEQRLNSYYNSSRVDELLNKKTDSATTDQNTQDISNLKSELGNKVDTTTLSNYYTSSKVDSLLTDKANKNDVTTLTNRLDTLTNGASTTLDTLKEIGDEISKNTKLIDTLNNSVGKISNLESKVETNKTNFDDNTVKFRSASDFRNDDILTDSYLNDKKAEIISYDDSLIRIAMKRQGVGGHYNFDIGTTMLTFSIFNSNGSRVALTTYPTTGYLTGVINNYYQKSDIDSKFESYYTSSKIDSLLAAKEDTGYSYSKKEIDSLLSNKLDSSRFIDAYTKGEVNNLLANKANKSDISQLRTDISTKLNSDTIKNYYTSTQVDNLLVGKVNTAALNSYYNSSKVDELLGNKVDSSTLSNYYTSSKVNELLNSKVDTTTLSSYYTSSKIDTLLNDKANKNDVTTLTNRLDTLTNGASTTLDTLKEIGDQITKNSSLIDTLNNGVGQIATINSQIDSINKKYVKFVDEFSPYTVKEFGTVDNGGAVISTSSKATFSISAPYYNTEKGSGFISFCFFNNTDSRYGYNPVIQRYSEKGSSYTDFKLALLDDVNLFKLNEVDPLKNKIDSLKSDFDSYKKSGPNLDNLVTYKKGSTYTTFDNNSLFDTVNKPIVSAGRLDSHTSGVIIGAPLVNDSTAGQIFFGDKLKYRKGTTASWKTAADIDDVTSAVGQITPRITALETKKENEIKVSYDGGVLYIVSNDNTSTAPGSVEIATYSKSEVDSKISTINTTISGINKRLNSGTLINRYRGSQSIANINTSGIYIAQFSDTPIKSKYANFGVLEVFSDSTNSTTIKIYRPIISNNRGNLVFTKRMENNVVSRWVVTGTFYPDSGVTFNMKTSDSGVTFDYTSAWSTISSKIFTNTSDIENPNASEVFFEMGNSMRTAGYQRISLRDRETKVILIKSSDIFYYAHFDNNKMVFLNNALKDSGKSVSSSNILENPITAIKW